jgi:pimeloyl-ACP methyl ester carboxylesterase
MSAIIIDGSMVHYEALGKGRPIIFLHGWVGSWRYWINAMQVSSTSFRAYAIDLFGFGDSVHTPLNYTLDKQAELLSQFLDKMGIGKVAIVGHDLGALVGFAFVQRWHTSVDRIMAINCPLDATALNARMKGTPTADLLTWLSPQTPEATSALADASKTDLKAVTASIEGLQGDIVQGVKSFGVPSLFVYGANTPAITVPTQEKSDSLPTHMHQITLDGLGHFPMIDNPPQFNRLLIDFLALDSGAPPSELQMKEEWKRRVR